MSVPRRARSWRSTAATPPAPSWCAPASGSSISCSATAPRCAIRSASARTAGNGAATHSSMGKYLRPEWSAPAEIRRNKPGLPEVIPGGSPKNPMGAAALTLSGGEYAIHGTNVPGSIGGFGFLRLHPHVQRRRARSLRPRAFGHAGRGAALAAAADFPRAHVEMKVIAVRRVVVQRQHRAENRAGAVAYLAQKAALGVRVVPVLQ